MAISYFVIMITLMLESKHTQFVPNYYRMLLNPQQQMVFSYHKIHN